MAPRAWDSINLSSCAIISLLQQRHELSQAFPQQMPHTMHKAHRVSLRFNKSSRYLLPNPKKMVTFPDLPGLAHKLGAAQHQYRRLLTAFKYLSLEHFQWPPSSHDHLP